MSIFKQIEIGRNINFDQFCKEYVIVYRLRKNFGKFTYANPKTADRAYEILRKSGAGLLPVYEDMTI